MGQKGFGLVIFLIALFLIFAGIVGGLVAVKKYKPDLVTGIAGFGTVQKSENTPSGSPVPTVNSQTGKADTYFSDAPEAKVAALKRGRDAVRLTDLANLQQVINVVIQDAGFSVDKILCAGMTAPCFGSSYTGTRASNGSGWIKINIANQRNIVMPILPVDPVNDEKFHYVYCATDTAWEINAVLESEETLVRMKTDRGDDDTKYEVGSKLTLIGNVTGCKY